MHEEELLEFAKPGEEPALRKRYDFDDRPGCHGEYKLRLIGLTSLNPIRGEKKYPLGQEAVALLRLKELHEVWEKTKLRDQLQAKANAKPKKKS